MCICLVNEWGPFLLHFITRKIAANILWIFTPVKAPVKAYNYHHIHIQLYLHSKIFTSKMPLYFSVIISFPLNPTLVLPISLVPLHHNLTVDAIFFMWPFACGKYYPTRSLSRHDNGTWSGPAPRWLSVWLQRLRNRWTCRPARPLPEPTWPLRSPWPLNTQHICSYPWATAHNVKTFITHFHSLAQVKPGHRKKSTVHAGKKIG